MISPRKIDIQYFIRGIKEYRVTQIKRDLIKVEIVKGQDFTKNTIESIRRQILNGCHNEEIKVEVDLVQKIKRNTAKMRTVASLVK